MQTIAGWVCRTVVLMGTVVVAIQIFKHLTAASDGTAALPTITGDTWPPVPVKTSR